MPKKQNEAQRLAAELLKGKTFPAYPVMPLTEAAALLLRQDELLRQALLAMSRGFYCVETERFKQRASYGKNFSEAASDRADDAYTAQREAITAIRAHLEAK